MIEFYIDIEPKIPGSNVTIENFVLDDFTIRTINDCIEGEFDLSYVINRVHYGYYPTNAVGLLNDLILERDNLAKRDSHFISISGYQILYVDIVGGELSFFNSSVDFPIRPTQKPFAVLPYKQVYDEVNKRCMDCIYFIETHRNSG